MKPLRDLTCNITAEYKESELESGKYEIETRHENQKGHGEIKKGGVGG